MARSLGPQPWPAAFGNSGSAIVQWVPSGHPHGVSVTVAAEPWFTVCPSGVSAVPSTDQFPKHAKCTSKQVVQRGRAFQVSFQRPSMYVRALRCVSVLMCFAQGCWCCTIPVCSHARAWQCIDPLSNIVRTGGLPGRLPRIWRVVASVSGRMRLRISKASGTRPLVVGFTVQCISFRLGSGSYISNPIHSINSLFLRIRSSRP